MKRVMVRAVLVDVKKMEAVRPIEIEDDEEIIGGRWQAHQFELIVAKTLPESSWPWRKS